MQKNLLLVIFLLSAIVVCSSYTSKPPVFNRESDAACMVENEDAPDATIFHTESDEYADVLRSYGEPNPLESTRKKVQKLYEEQKLHPLDPECGGVVVSIPKQQVRMTAILHRVQCVAGGSIVILLMVIILFLIRSKLEASEY